MTSRRSLGRRFGWLWAAYAVSTFGTWVAFDAFPLIAILALHVGPAEVSALAAAGLAVAALVAVPLGLWVEFRRKRPVMMAMDLTRFAVLMTVPVAYALGRLTFAHLLVVFATYRLEHTTDDRVARVLSAWVVSSNAVIAALTAAWGLLAALTSVRIAIAIAGVLMLATPLLLPRRGRLEPLEPALGFAGGR